MLPPFQLTRNIHAGELICALIYGLPRNDLTPQQLIHRHYSEWLEVTSRERSNFNGVLFVRQVTNLGRDRFEGMTEEQICQSSAASSP